MDNSISEVDPRYLFQEAMELNTPHGLDKSQFQHRITEHNSERSNLMLRHNEEEPEASSSDFKTSHHIFRRHIFKHWKLELLSIVLALLGFVALILVLVYFNGKNVTSFHHSIVTPNSIVAAFSTVIRGSMLFLISSMISQEKWNYLSKDRHIGRPIISISILDSASRGALGCINLLCSKSKIIKNS
jgi:hypothetical protein